MERERARVQDSRDNDNACRQDIARGGGYLDGADTFAGDCRDGIIQSLSASSLCRPLHRAKGAYS